MGVSAEVGRHGIALRQTQEIGNSVDVDQVIDIDIPSHRQGDYDSWHISARLAYYSRQINSGPGDVEAPRGLDGTPKEVPTWQTISVLWFADARPHS